jgi:hypothetical protein
MPTFSLNRLLRTAGLVLVLAGPVLAHRAGAEPVKPDPGVAGDTGIDKAETTRLIDRLGDANFEIRESAARQLREIGLPALVALREASNHRSLEVRYRVRRLLVDVEQLDHERRLAAFEKNPEAADDDLLPGLKRYRQLVGSDANSLRFFVEMQRAERQLFQMSRQPGVAFDNRYDARCADLQIECNLRQQMNKVPQRLGALLFLASDPAHGERDQSSNMLYGLAHVQEFNNLINPMKPGATAPESPAVRKVMGLWIGKPGGGIVYQRLMLAMSFNFREGLEPAIDVLRRPGIGFQTQYALLAAGRFGSRDQLEVIERHLNDKTVLTTTAVNNKTTYTSQVRDVALAVAAHLTEQDVGKYGFKNLQKHPQYLFAPNTLGFANDGERAAALANWNSWKASQQTEPATAEIP